MPAAASWIDLKSYHNHITLATREILRAAGLDNVFLERNDTRLPASHLLVSFQRGEAINLETLPGGRCLYDAFESATLTIALFTWRPENQATPSAGVQDQHAQFEGRVEAALTPPAEPYTIVNLPYYEIQTLRPLSPVRDFDSELMQDSTTLTYRIDWTIRPSAYAGL